MNNEACSFSRENKNNRRIDLPGNFAAQSKDDGREEDDSQASTTAALFINQRE